MSMRIRILGSIRDYTDFLASLARTNLRAMHEDADLAAEITRRLVSPCLCVVGNPRNHLETGCHCATGVQYKTDEDIQENFEGCAPDDVWSDGRSLLKFHEKMGRGKNDPLLGDCDDLEGLLAAASKFHAPKRRIYVSIAQPLNSSVAHAFQLQDFPPAKGLRQIKLENVKVGKKTVNFPLWVVDLSADRGMYVPPESFYVTGNVSVIEIREEDL